MAGLLAVLVALVSQLALGAIVAPDDGAARRDVAALEAVSVLCVSGHALPGPHAPAPHHGVDVSLLPLSDALAVSAVILPSVETLPPPCTLRRGVRGGLAPTRAPPRPTFSDSYPRGPPALV